MIFKDLENEDFKLQQLVATDYEKLFAVASDPQIWEQHPDHLRYTPAGFSVYFDYLLKCDQPYLIIDKNTNSCIGATAFYQFDKAQNSIAIGYSFLACSYWGGLTNKSIKRLMINYAFQFVDHFIFHVREKNFRSQAALVKIGATKSKEYPAPHDPTSIQYEYIIRK